MFLSVCCSYLYSFRAAQWRVYRRVIELKPENIDWVVKATVALHNFQRFNLRALVTQAEPEDAPALHMLKRSGSNHAAQDALDVW